MDGLDASSTYLISELCFQTRAKIVMCSNSRLKYSRHEIQPFLGVLKYYLFSGIDALEWRTDADGPSRGHQIRRWLCDRADIESYIIIDDSPKDLEHSSNKLVKVKNEAGFRAPQFDEAYLMLTT